jgi:eukaryotic translation initiation factor 2C
MGQIAALSGPVSQIPNTIILSVIRPSADDLARRVSRLTPEIKEVPTREPWRVENEIGHPTRIFTNHYSVDTSKLPGSMFLYQIALQKINRDGTVAEDKVADEDVRTITECVMQLQKNHTEWTTPLAFNGRSLIFTASRLSLPDTDSAGREILVEELSLQSNRGAGGSQRAVHVTKYRLILTLVDSIPNPPEFATADAEMMEERNITALSVSLSSFARWGVLDRNPEWFLAGDSKNKLFHRDEPALYVNSKMFLVKRGYYVGLKQCMAGLTFVCDMNANLFLAGGPMIEVLLKSANLKDVGELVKQSIAICSKKERRDKLIQDIKGAKIQLLYINHNRKAKSIGPPANHADSAFDYTDEATGKSRKITVAQYFEIKARDDPAYAAHMPTGKLKYPGLLTVNIGSTSKPVLIPPELMMVPSGQVRPNSMTPDIVAEIVKHSAILPAARFEFINNTTALGAINDSPACQAFFGGGISKTPMEVQGRILPQAKLQYKGGVVDPGQNGQWKVNDKYKFYASPPGNDAGSGLPFAIMQVANARPHAVSPDLLRAFCSDLIKTCSGLGLRLKEICPFVECGTHPEVIKDNLEMLKNRGVRFAIVVMCDDQSYGVIKCASDSMCLVTQCVRKKNVERTSPSLFSQLALKINAKIGGTNHALASRSADPAAFGFGKAHGCISWLFNEPCMLLGLDVSHAERHVDFESIAAVVASMDAQCSQYVGQLSAQKSRQEIIESLQEMVVELLKAFKARNKVYPKRIVAFRDGVSDGQMKEVRDKEVAAIKGAFELLGFPDSAVKIVFIVCQKNHHTRFFYDNRADGLINTGPGLVVDKDITSAVNNDFYLNSHVAIQGTCKAAKYTLLVDEVGVKLNDIEMLAYWTTYLYCRCNRSVSLATPAYYAHHLSKRGATLFAAGKGGLELIEISRLFATSDASCMFFL